MTTYPFDWRDFEAELEAELARAASGHPADGPLPSFLAFTPVPRARARRTGWSPARQQMFLFALSRCGSVARAARSVGMSARSAYRLVHAPGADDFARAWDAALDEGLDRVRTDALKDALGGVFVPVFRRGKLVRVEHRKSDRLALALLAGKPHDFADDYRRSMMSRREHKADLDEYDAAKAALDRERVGPVERRERLQEVMDRIVERIGERAAARAAGGPRIVRL